MNSGISCMTNLVTVVSVAAMSWEKEIEELRTRQKMAEAMGGEEKVARQHARGKLDARERIRRLVDEGSFREIGKIAGRGAYDADDNLTNLAASNFIFGRADIDGRPVVASADEVRAFGRVFEAHGAVGPMEDQALHQ